MNMIHWIEDAPGVGWYYNWRPDQMYTQSRVRRDVEFVPMIHGAKDVNKRIRSDLRVRHLLAFNEPDGGSGSHQSRHCSSTCSQNAVSGEHSQSSLSICTHSS